MVYPLLKIESAIWYIFITSRNYIGAYDFWYANLTLIFRNFYASLPIDLFKAARIDGGNFLKIFLCYYSNVYANYNCGSNFTSNRDLE